MHSSWNHARPIYYLTGFTNSLPEKMELYRKLKTKKAVAASVFPQQHMEESGEQCTVVFAWIVTELSRFGG
jgi:hypothetical protein